MTSDYTIAVLPGDGIGPEVIDSALDVITAAAEQEQLHLDLRPYEAGSGLYRTTGTSISDETIEAAGNADAVLLGAMGLPDVRRPDGTEEGPQVELRDRFRLYASLRPCVLYPGVPTRIRSSAINMLIIRETTEGMFAGRHDLTEPSDETVSDRMTITRSTSEKLFELAFEQARARRTLQGTAGLVTLFDKANALRSQAFLRRIFYEVAGRHPDIAADHLHVDAGAMMLVTDPERFDVVVMENIFGDIASEVAAGVVGGLGLAPSADLGESRGVFQPCHGSAPDIVGKGVANPIAAILSAAMMFEWLGQQHGDDRCSRIAAVIRQSVATVLEHGPRTPDLNGDATTLQVTAAILVKLRHPLPSTEYGPARVLQR